MNSALHSATVCLLILTLSTAAPIRIRNKTRLLSVHTGYYVQLKPDNGITANAGDLNADPSTQFIINFSNGLLTLARVEDMDQLLTLQEAENSTSILFTASNNIMMGSGDSLFPSHVQFEYRFEFSVLSTVLRARHSNGQYCYLAFEENGNLVEDPCSPDLDLDKARVVLVPLRDHESSL